MKNLKRISSFILAILMFVAMAFPVLAEASAGLSMDNQEENETHCCFVMPSGRDGQRRSNLEHVIINRGEIEPDRWGGQQRGNIDSVIIYRGEGEPEPGSIPLLPSMVSPRQGPCGFRLPDGSFCGLPIGPIIITAGPTQRNSHLFFILPCTFYWRQETFVMGCQRPNSFHHGTVWHTRIVEWGHMFCGG
ncbi:MAG: hypothetical protein FWC13_04710 [Oscillospiraceae bacterium]|nr:hypothetical protein [Oscillospiraceae bacterium]